MTSPKPIPIIAGPTAVGKTAASLSVATALGAEIISADSRQIYKEFSIGTACPTADELSQIRHHFIQTISIGEPYSSGIFARNIAPVVESVQRQGKRIVVTGGSTLYVHALIHGLSDIPDVAPEWRSTLNERLEKEGAKALYDELLRVDPDFAATLDPTKSQRIVRGLEVFYGAGAPLSSFHASPPLPGIPFTLFVLHRERERLYERIDQRVDMMVKAGLVDELKAVLATGVDTEDNAFRTIGYQELLPYLKGVSSLDEAITLIKRNSRRYAKRQLTWYKRYQDAVWIDVDQCDAATLIMEHMGN